MTIGDGVRRNIAHVEPSERALLVAALLELNRRRFPGSPTDEPPGGVTLWFKQDEIHQATHVHGSSYFIPWHRELVNRLEAMLREVDSRLSLHYWDWTQDPRSIPNANLGGGTTGTLNLFTAEFMGYGGSNEAPIGPPWQNASMPWDPDGFYVPEGSPVRDAQQNPAFPPETVIRSVNGSPASTDEDLRIEDAIDFPTMWPRMKTVHDKMHTFVNMGGPHISFRDPFVFLLHSNVDRLYAMWQMRHRQRREPATVYGADGVIMGVDIQPWAGTPPTVRPWAPPENAREQKSFLHPSVVAPPSYDTMPQFPSGALLRYEDLTPQGIAGHSDPDIIGGSSWADFRFLVGGSNGVIYAVNAAGELLRYEDLTAQGIAGHSDPVVIGGGGWADFRFLVGGSNGVIYAVNAAGELLRYEDLTAQGIAGHSDPVVIGGGGWADFTFLVGGDNGVIYAVNAAGELLRYEDLTAQGIAGHSDPVVIGGGGWADFTFLVGGDNGVIYAVNAAGELLRYEDLTAQGIAGHSDPVVIGGSSWDDFRFLVGGDNGVIYAVVT